MRRQQWAVYSLRLRCVSSLRNRTPLAPLSAVLHFAVYWDCLNESIRLCPHLSHPSLGLCSRGRRHHAEGIPHHHPAPSSFRTELACSTLVLDEVTKTVATVTVREKHDKKCGGDPGTAPRRFTMEIDLKTGAALWDNNDEMEMKPIPHRAAP
jgi:hypothetical protein